MLHWLFLLSASFIWHVALGATAQFSNDRRFLFDVEGNMIDAYGSKINYMNGTYYLYGNSWSIKGSEAYGIKSYSSSDLANWKYEGFLYDPDTTDACDGSGGCGRPHIIYNPKSEKYILWANSGGYVVAESDHPATGYKFLGSQPALDPAFDDLNPADFAVEVINNAGYIVYSVLNFTYSNAGSLWPQITQSLRIGQLTANLMNTTTVTYAVSSSSHDIVDTQAESPDLIFRNGFWYIFASNTCGYCSGTLAVVYRSSSIEGPWKRQIISGDSCNSQVEGILPVVDPKTKETTYVWHGTSVPGGPRTGFGGHNFQPLVFRADGSIQDLDCNSDATFEVALTLGQGVVASGPASKSVDKSPDIAPYYSICDSDRYILYQTWTAQRTGLLKSVSVNIAATTQSTSLEITVFNFSSIHNLLEPGYLYTKLGSSSFLPANLTWVFDNATVNIDQHVRAGEQLGISISGADFAPYCHLEYPLTEHQSAHGMVLFQQGIGQYSARGLQGTSAPIQVREQKGIKFWAVVE